MAGQESPASTVPEDAIAGDSPYWALRPMTPEEKAAMDSRESMRLSGVSGLPKCAEEETFETYRPMPGTEKAFEFAKAYQPGPHGRGVVFAGPCGVGNGHLAHAILRGWLAAGRAGICQNVPDLLNRLRRSQRPDATEELDDMLDLLAATPLLVLDDLGAGRTTPFGVEQVYLIADARERAQLPLIVTTNYAGPADLADKLGGIDGERIVSRLLGNCDWYVMEGLDYRLTRKRVVRP